MTETKLSDTEGGQRVVAVMFRDHPLHPTPAHYPTDRWMLGPTFPNTPRGLEQAAAASALIAKGGPIVDRHWPEREIAPMLVLSTAHLPQVVCDDLNGYDGVLATEKTDRDDQSVGWFMWVPNDPVEHAAGYDESGPPAEVLTIQLYARVLGCDWVMFDADGPTVDDLPRWEW